MRAIFRLIRLAPLLLLSPLFLIVSVIAFAVEDMVWGLAGRKRPRADTQPTTGGASVVIPNWNGRDLLENYLPSVVTALAGNPSNEIVVVDNGSSDGSAEFCEPKLPTGKGRGARSQPRIRRRFECRRACRDK